MIKLDRIFFAACGLFVLGLALGIGLDSELALLFVVAAYLLRPTLHAFELAPSLADERQVLIHSRSGNIAFIAVMLAAVGIAIAQSAQGETPEAMYALLTIGIGSRAITGLLMGGEYRKAASTIIIVVGLVVATFALVSDGFSTATFFVGGIALAFAALGAVALKFPRPVALIQVAAALFLVFALKLYLFLPRTLAMWMVVVCFLIAALCLYRGRQGESDESPKHSRRVRWISLVAGIGVLVAFFTVLSTRTEKASGNKPGDTAGSSRTVTGTVEIQNVSCTGRIEFYGNGKLKSCTLACDDTLSGQPLEKGTVVVFSPDGDLDWCFLQHETEIQGHLCKGESHGFMTSFYPNGKLKTIWLGRDEVIQSVPCAKYSFWADVFGNGAAIYFWENGNLKRARISGNFTIEGQTFHSGDVVTLDEAGKLVAESAR
jgi:hypothetical protein